MEPHHTQAKEGNMTTRTQPIAYTVVHYHNPDRFFGAF